MWCNVLAKLFVTQDMTPKQILLALPLLCLAAIANCQRTTYSVGFNSGLFRYTGEGASHTSGITTHPSPRTLNEGMPGKKSGFSYEVTLNAQRITKSRILFGGELAWQSMQSRTTVVAQTPTIYSSFFMFATGKTTVTSQFITLTPFVGYRLLDKKIKLDISTGLEITGCINREENIKATNSSTGEKLSGSHELAKRPDHRVRLQLNTSLGRFGLTTGYAIGLTNFYPEPDAMYFFPEARSSFIRLGLNYRLN